MRKYDEMRKELKYSIIDLDADHYNLSKFMQVIDEIFIKYRGNIEQTKIGGWIPCSERLPGGKGDYPKLGKEDCGDVILQRGGSDAALLLLFALYSHFSV